MSLVGVQLGTPILQCDSGSFILRYPCFVVVLARHHLLVHFHTHLSRDAGVDALANGRRRKSLMFMHAFMPCTLYWLVCVTHFLVCGEACSSLIFCISLSFVVCELMICALRDCRPFTLLDRPWECLL
jgi:hypothetical protein